jgi:hypothetical protein
MSESARRMTLTGNDTRTIFNLKALDEEEFRVETLKHEQERQEIADSDDKIQRQVVIPLGIVEIDIVVARRCEIRRDPIRDRERRIIGHRGRLSSLITSQRITQESQNGPSSKYVGQRIEEMEKSPQDLEREGTVPLILRLLNVVAFCSTKNLSRLRGGQNVRHTQRKREQQLAANSQQPTARQSGITDQQTCLLGCFWRAASDQKSA